VLDEMDEHFFELSSAHLFGISSPVNHKVMSQKILIIKSTNFLSITTMLLI